MKHDLIFKPLSTKTWKDFETLFGKRGACGGCWCMFWRLTSKEYDLYKGESNRIKIHKLVQDKKKLGIIAFKNDLPIGWCSISPRDTLTRLENSNLLKRIDDVPVWSITCLFVKKEFRRQDISSLLISEAAKFAFKNGALVVEAYPIIPKKKEVPEIFAFTGFASAYKKAKFKIVRKPNENRLIMRISKKSD